MKPIKLSYDMYYSHKEYFDSALISLLERQQDQIQKLKEKCLIYDATIYKLRGKVKIQKMMLDELKYASKVNKDFYKEIEKLIVENERLTEENNLLKSEVEYFRLNQPKSKDTTNSNIPSSFVMFKATVNNRSISDKRKGGQAGHPLHKSRLLKPDRIIPKYVKNVPTGAIKCVDDNGNIYYATQVINASFKTVITEYRYYLSQDGIMLSNRIMNQFKINPVVYSDNLKEDVLYLYSKGIIAFDRLSRILYTLSKNRLDIKPSTIVDWVFDYAKTHKCDNESRLQELD